MSPIPSPNGRASATALIAVAFLLVWSGASAQVTEITPAPAFSGERLVSLPTEDWITNGGNAYNQRYSPLDQINRETVAGLRGVWRARLNGSGLAAKYSGEAQPIVYDGVVYVITGADDVFAISVDSGELLWTYEANLNQSIDTICCGWTNRGVAIGEGKVFFGQLDGRLVALDQTTGAIAWSTQAERWQEGFSITSAPLYYDGLVITGFAGAEYGVRGRVKAYDAEDGSLVWTFYTIPGPGEIGHETWPQDNDVYLYGGGTVWQTPAVDPALDLVYFSTGNPGPDFNGNIRAGDNLFSASIVAVDGHTGEYRWHFQQVHHDIWDYDAPSPVLLFDIEIDGEMRRAIAEPGKTGWVYILDRETGEPLIGIEERPVPQEPRQATSPTQPYPIGDAFIPQHVDIGPEGYPPLVNQGRIFTPFWTEGAVMKPSHNGGANWPGSSYDPDTGIMYICATDRMSFFKGGNEEEPLPPPEGERFLGGEFGAVPFHVSGVLAAMDMRTNRLVWQQRLSDRCYSGTLTTGGGLVFLGRNDGRLTALDSRDGTLLWEFQTGAGMNSPVSTFERNGQQYIVAYSAGNLFAGSQRGDSVWLFSLGGTMEEVVPESEAPEFVASLDREADTANGQMLYNAACTFCHGDVGEGGAGGVALTNATNLAAVMQQIREGLNAMPPFGGALSPEQIQDIATFVVEDLPH
ncbi:MAG TPA: PQQ-binding-like beta-propeller repeat protein [Gammaproteobacteria bacterium]